MPQSALFVALPLYGHLRPLTVQARVLAARGWTVRVASLDCARDSVEEAAPFVGLGAFPAGVESVEEVFRRATAEPDFQAGSRLIAQWCASLWTPIYDGALEASAELRPDLVITDVATPAGLDAADSLGVPAVINNPDVLPMVSEAILEPAPDVPLMHAGYGRATRPGWARLLHRPLRRLGLALARQMTAGWIEPYRAARGLAPVDPLRRAEDRQVIVNTVFGLEYSRPLPANIRMVGPILDPDEPSLPDELDAWLSEPGPVAYVNLGTIADPSNTLVDRIAAGLARSGMRALWVLRGPAARTASAASPRIRVEPWVASQMAVLHHPNVRVFVSHCGVNSVHESVACGVPLVGVPLFADQPDMAFRAVDAGIAVALDKNRFGVRELSAEVVRVANDSSFTRAMPALQAAFRQAGGAERAADVLEGAVRGPARPPSRGRRATF